MYLDSIVFSEKLCRSTIRVQRDSLLSTNLGVGLFCHNWPGFVRWLYSDKSIESMREKLDTFVTLARENKDLKSWQEKVLMVSHIREQKNISWLSDQNLKDFFNLESTKYKDEPLSESLENGLY